MIVAAVGAAVVVVESMGVIVITLGDRLVRIPGHVVAVEHAVVFVGDGGTGPFSSRLIRLIGNQLR